MKQVIKTAHAPSPIGPYNQAIKAGDFLFISGQVCRNASDGEMKNENIQTETLQVMQNLNAILQEAGLSFAHVCKTTIFLSNMDDFQAVNEIYATFFNEEEAPARETVQVSRLPLNVNVEISMVAYFG